MPSNRSQTFGVISLILAAFLYATYAFFTRNIGLHLGIFTTFALRSFFVLILLLPVLFFFREWKVIPKRHWPYLIVWTFLSTAAGLTTIVAYNHIPIGMTLFLFYAAAILTGYGVGILFYKEKLTRLKIFSLLATFFGLVIIVGANVDLHDPVYLFVAMMSGLFSGLWEAFSRRVSRRYSVVQIMAIDSVLNTVFNSFLAIVFSEPISNIQIDLTLVFVFLYAVAAYGANSLVVLGFKNLDAETGSQILPLEIVFGAIIGYLFFSETVSLSTILGGVLIFAGVILANYHPAVKTFHLHFKHLR